MADTTTGMLTTKQLTERLNIKRHQLVHLIDSGKVPDAVHRVSNRRMFTENEAQEIERYLAAHKKDGTANNG